MSLDVYLIGEEKRVECTCECGHKHSKIERETLYDSNITHNLNKMANEAGIYEACWRSEEIGATKAKDIIGKLALAVDLMKKEPDRFKKFDSPNGWGKYEHFLPWVESYLKACEENPDATIEVSR
jgi:hypothetical protein